MMHYCHRRPIKCRGISPTRTLRSFLKTCSTTRTILLRYMPTGRLPTRYCPAVRMGNQTGQNLFQRRRALLDGEARPGFTIIWALPIIASTLPICFQPIRLARRSQFLSRGTMVMATIITESAITGITMFASGKPSEA